MEKCKKNNVTTALNAKKEKIHPASVSKDNSNREKQVILLMIPNGEKWQYLAVKKLSILLRGITKYHGDFYCMNCFQFFATANKLQSHKRVCEKKVFCKIIMPSEGTKILELSTIYYLCRY